MKKLFISFLSAVVCQSASAQVCSTDEFVFDYFGKYQCKLGGTPEACAVISKGALSGMLGVAGYIGGEKLGAAVGTKLGDREARIRAEISDSLFDRPKISQVHSEWNKAFAAARKGQQYSGNLGSLANDSRWALFDGLSADATQKRLDSEFLEKRGRLQLHMEGKRVLTSVELEKLQLEMNDIFERAKSHLFQKLTARKYRWMRAGLKGSKLTGARVGKVGLGTLAAVVTPGAELVQNERLFSKCVSRDDWFSNRGDNELLKSFIDIDNDCAMDVKDAKLNELIEMFPDERDEFFNKCPSCCAMMQRRNRQLTEKIDRENPTVVIDESSCGVDSMTAEVILNGHRYRHSYKKGNGQYELTTGLIPNNDDINSNNQMKIGITNDGHLTNPSISNVNGGIISSQFGNDNVPTKMTQWYDSLKGKQSPPASSQDLADTRQVQYSVAEQIKAANLSFRSIKSFCENSRRKPGAPGSAKSQDVIQ